MLKPTIGLVLTMAVVGTALVSVARADDPPVVAGPTAAAGAEASGALDAAPAPENAAQEGAAAAKAATDAAAALAAEKTAQADEDTKQLKQINKLYTGVRKAVGAEHVLLTAAAYVGEERLGHHRLKAGVAGIVSVPLLGIGGNHGGGIKDAFDWYPVLATEDATNAFANFQDQVKQYTKVVDAVSGQTAEQAFDTLFESVKTTVTEIVDADPEKPVWKLARAVELCLQDASTLLNAVDPKTTKADTAAKWLADHSDANVDVLRTDCDALLKEVRNAKRDLASLKKLVSDYWKTVAQQPSVTSRHNVLLGPSVGLPVTSDPTKRVLLGGLLEVGGGPSGLSKYVRLAVTGGIQLRYEHPGAKPGWFCGLALSGALGDDLVHLINGGLAGARQVAALQL